MGLSVETEKKSLYMETINNNFPFPQADDINKIIILLNMDDEALLSDSAFLGRFLGDITERQVSYYTSAMKYLGLITAERKYTPHAVYMRELSTFNQNIELAKLLLTDPVLAKVYFMEKALETKLDRDDVIDVMREYVDLGSENMYQRRSQTVMSWISWINVNFNDKF